MTTPLDHLIDRLRPMCEYIHIHAEYDRYDPANLLNPRIGGTVKFIEHPVPMEFTGPNVESILSKAWKRRP